MRYLALACDYDGFAGAVVLGDANHQPRHEEIVDLLAKSDQDVVANLLGVRLADRPAFFAGLLPRLLELRARRDQGQCARRRRGPRRSAAPAQRGEHPRPGASRDPVAVYFTGMTPGRGECSSGQMHDPLALVLKE